MSKTTTRRGLFGALRKAALGEDQAAKAPATAATSPTGETVHPSLRHPEGKPFVGLRDIKPRSERDVAQMAMPAETALSAEMARLGETPPPWIPGSKP